MKKWQVREQKFDDLEKQLLSARKIKDKERFFNPDYEKDLHDPFEMKDMEKAVKRILEAINGNEKIIVYGDYDADGVCASAIFHDFFQKIGFENFETYIPDRHREGYGLNMKAMDEFIKNGIDLIITLDCGISDYDEIKKLNEKKIDTVVLDHHLEPDKLPKAVAIVDPKQKKDKYPFDMLAGAGVAFKTVQALIDKGGFNITPGWEKWLLDLVAIGTVADMMPLIDENRVLVYYGLKVLRKTNRSGIKTFFGKFGLDQKNITEDDIAFTIAPRINIASRMEHANTSYVLLTTESSTEASWIFSRLNSLNGERRDIVEDILKEIDKRIGRMKEKPAIIVEGNPSWNTGVLGLTANRVLENYYCPVFLWGKEGTEKVKGSCRSDGSVNLVDLMKELPAGILEESGGHTLSAGFSLSEDKIEQFKKELLRVYNRTKKDIAEDVLWVDKKIDLNELNGELLETVEKFRPFGIGNSCPVFLFENLQVFNVRMFGNGGIHLQMDFSARGGQNGIISAVGFFMNAVEVKKGDFIDLAASVERNTFNGRNELRLRIVDFKIK